MAENNTETKPKKKKLVVRLSLSSVEQESVRVLSTLLHIEKPQDLFRYLLADTHKRETQMLMRYGKPVAVGFEKKTAKETRDEKMRRLLALTDKELTEKFIEVGFLPAGCIMPDNETLFNESLVETQDGEKKIAYKTYAIDKQGNRTGESGSSVDIFLSWNEIIREIEKEGKFDSL